LFISYVVVLDLVERNADIYGSKYVLMLLSDSKRRLLATDNERCKCIMRGPMCTLSVNAYTFMLGTRVTNLQLIYLRNMVFALCLYTSRIHILIKEEFSQKHNLFRTDGIFCNWNYMFRPLLAIFWLLQYCCIYSIYRLLFNIV